MANSETGTRTNIPLGGEYQVFLNFRGCDIRHGFADTLYHFLDDAQIRIFMDDAEIRAGEIIGDKLMQAIDNSKLYVPIFSPNYASSHWCLIELAKMIENISKSKEDENKKVILPIFYDVEPEELKLKPEEHKVQRPSYRDAILNLEEKKVNQERKFSTEDVDRWRTALRKVDASKGLKRKDHSGDGDLSKAVVSEVVNWLQTRQRKLTKDLVGMEDRLAAIYNLLEIDSGGVRLIGIYGMGGMGKTTLAKKIFNQLCSRFGKSCTFLDNIGERAKSNGIVKLQEQLLSHISTIRVPHKIVNSDEGIKYIEETLCNKEVLIVLDDVNDGNQILELIGTNTLYYGTRILVTTRDNGVLNIRGLKYSIEHYELKGLSDKHALQLFSRHAFNIDSPPVDYYILSKGIVSTTGGLPLAVQAIGASLYGQKKIKIWKEVLQKLGKTLNKDVLGKLTISYDALEPDQKEIFLDVACFFIGRNMTEPIFVWDDCGFSPEHDIDVLIKRCMIKVLDNNRFWMHNQFRDLGRAIAKKWRSRLWDRDNITHELRSMEIKRSVQALDLQAECGNPITVTAEEIERFPHLQFLWLSNVICLGDFTGCLSKLKWIGVHYSHSFYSWLEPKHHQGFEATNLPMENLVVAKLSGREFTGEKVSNLTEGARKLKVLTIYCDPPEGNPRDFD